MPKYTVKCRDCEHTFDVTLKMKDPLPPCPECDGKLRKVITQMKFILKGEGFAARN